MRYTVYKMMLLMMDWWYLHITQPVGLNLFYIILPFMPRSSKFSLCMTYCRICHSCKFCLSRKCRAHIFWEIIFFSVLKHFVVHTSSQSNRLSKCTYWWISGNFRLSEIKHILKISQRNTHWYFNCLYASAKASF